LLKKRRILDFGTELLKNILRKQDISAYQTLLFQLLPDSVKKPLLLRTVPYIQKDFKTLIFEDQGPVVHYKP
jgi:hypothetical protein